MKKLRSFRIDKWLLDTAKDKGLDVNVIVNAALAKAVKDKRCPYCNQKTQRKK